MHKRSGKRISTHAPRTGSDTPLVTDKTLTLEFQPTLPARGATTMYPQLFHSAKVYFNPRSPHGERRNYLSPDIGVYDFNPRSPHGERLLGEQVCGRQEISTHAPRTGSDPTATLWRASHRHFNPRSPHGERQYLQSIIDSAESDFNPRSPHGERHGFVAL